jgi:hypothetical protein
MKLVSENPVRMDQHPILGEWESMVHGQGIRTFGTGSKDPEFESQSYPIISNMSTRFIKGQVLYRLPHDSWT